VLEGGKGRRGYNFNSNVVPDRTSRKAESLVNWVIDLGMERRYWLDELKSVSGYY